VLTFPSLEPIRGTHGINLMLHGFIPVTSGLPCAAGQFLPAKAYIADGVPTFRKHRLDSMQRLYPE